MISGGDRMVGRKGVPPSHSLGDGTEGRSEPSILVVVVGLGLVGEPPFLDQPLTQAAGGRTADSKLRGDLSHAVFPFKQCACFFELVVDDIACRPHSLPVNRRQ